ncbi:MAG: hypothetical protein KDB85_08615 [Chitinophagales bacterium]|nr:hypothetical protein [Chitinophagales bacterium]HQU53528.1 hypothetical protein [Saprospiraceae bacterium]
MALSCYILEGTWWNHKEVPQVLPYFQALELTDGGIRLSHRSVRTLDDIKYWASKIPKNERAFLYFACHGERQSLQPISGSKNAISNDVLLDALYDSTKENAVDFLHFGCCQMIKRLNKDESIRSYLEYSGARWVSGYSKSVDWFKSMLLDLALLADFAIPIRYASKKKHVKISYRGQDFINNYQALSKSLGFAGGYKSSRNGIEIFQ